MHHAYVHVIFIISSATQATQSAEKTGRKLGNQVIRKGYMSIHNLGIMKGGKSTNLTIGGNYYPGIHPIINLVFILLSLLRIQSSEFQEDQDPQKVNI